MTLHENPHWNVVVEACAFLRPQGRPQEQIVSEMEDVVAGAVPNAGAQGERRIGSLDAVPLPVVARLLGIFVLGGDVAVHEVLHRRPRCAAEPPSVRAADHGQAERVLVEEVRPDGSFQPWGFDVG